MLCILKHPIWRTFFALNEGTSSPQVQIIFFFCFFCKKLTESRYWASMPVFNHTTRKNVLFTIQQTLGRELSQTRNISRENSFCSPQFPLAAPFQTNSKHSSAISQYNPYLNRQGPRLNILQSSASLQDPFQQGLWLSMKHNANLTWAPFPCIDFVQSHAGKTLILHERVQRPGQGLNFCVPDCYTSRSLMYQYPHHTHENITRICWKFPPSLSSILPRRILGELGSN